jgi:HAE1 family hydrophobic/amphiphilic exporter-1
LDKLDNWYAKRINWAVRHRWTVLFVCFGIFIASLFTFPHIKSEFFPSQDSGSASATLELPIGTRVEKAQEIALQLTDIWKKRYDDDLVVCNFRVGQADDENAFASMSDNGSHIISFNLRFVPVTERERKLAVICDEMRADIRRCPEIVRSNVLQSGGGGMGGENRASFEIYGYDFAVTDDLAQELKGRLSANTDIFSQVNISRAYQLEYQVEFDRDKLALHGIELSYAAMSVRNVRNYINGVFVTKFCEDGDEYKVKVHYVPEFRNKIYTIENIVLTAPTGAKIRIKEVANVVQIETPSTIERKDRSRIVTVDVVMAAGVALKDGIEFGMECIRDMTIPSGYSIQVANSH